MMGDLSGSDSRYRASEVNEWGKSPLVIKRSVNNDFESSKN